MKEEENQEDMPESMPASEEKQEQQPENIDQPNNTENSTIGMLPIEPHLISEDAFDAIPIAENSKNALRDMGFQKMTKIQAKAIPPLLTGVDLLGKAKTGSGKTLAFLVPAVEILLKNKFTPRKGRTFYHCILIDKARE
jgi:ATP-dependent RNA helicase DDX18/HAS1